MAKAFWRQFAIYSVFVTTLGLLRLMLGQVNGLMGFLAWEAVYIPVCAVLALVLAYRHPD